MDPELLPVASYFETHYIGTLSHPPKFPIKLWNVRDRLLNNIPRTSNYVEGWHSRLNKKVGHYRPAISRLLLEILREQQTTENILAKVDNGSFPCRRSRKYFLLTNRLKKTSLRYNKKICLSIDLLNLYP
jgi:hypothetical protein